MSFTGPEINKINGGLGRRSASKDNVLALITTGVVTAEYTTLGNVVKLIQLKDAEDLGFNAAYDSTNAVLVYYHIAEFFRLNPNGTLFLQVNAQTVSMEDMVDKASALYAKKVIQFSIDDKNQVKSIGLVRNIATGYTPTITTGLDQDSLDAVAKAQELIDDYATQNIFIDGVFVEGISLSSTLSALVDARTLAARNVTIVIGADPAVLALDAKYAKTAAMGAWLGSVGVRRVHESVGSVDIENKPNAKKANENYTLTDAANERFIKAALSNGTLISNLTPAEKQALTDKGYAYVGSYNGYDGIYWNSAPTCISVADDYAYVENNRVWGKAAR
ncbi:MAG: DUF2586 domain-containing protein [Bacteroidia bacterium]|nr:DUF2586 domain-containing protein [Bacteroidia bacterium]